MTTRTQFARAQVRKQPKQGRSRELVEAVLEGAARVFDREGLDATTNRVAEQAGVSIGSLYQYFPNKESLLVALAERHLNAAMDRVHQVLETHEQVPTLGEFMKALVQAVIHEHRQHPHLRALLRLVGPSVPELAGRFAECVADAERGIVVHLKRLHPEVPNPELRAKLVTSAVDGLVHNAEGLEFDDAFEQEVVLLCTRYLEH